jgi:hypothetical protein
MIDGRLAVFALAAFVAFLVIVWAQLRAGGLDWTRLLISISATSCSSRLRLTRCSAWKPPEP